MQTNVHPDSAKKIKVTRYILDPSIEEWCVEQNVQITIKTVLVLSHPMPYMSFASFSDLLKFKLTFQ